MEGAWIALSISRVARGGCQMGGNPLCYPRMHRVASWVLLGPLARKKGFFLEMKN